MDEDELKERKFEKVLLDEDVALRLAQKPWEFLLSMVRHLIASKPTSLEEDEAILNKVEEEGDSDRGIQTDRESRIKKRCALIFRIDEKRILKRLEERIKQQLQ